MNLFSFYIFLFFYILKEMLKFKEKKYFIFFCNKQINNEILYCFYFILEITLFIEDFTKKNSDEQTIINMIFSLINFLLFISFWILSNFFVYEENCNSNEEAELI